MKRFLIHVETEWVGTEETYRAEAESREDLYEIAEQLALENFLACGFEETIAEEHGYDPDKMIDDDWNELWNTIDESEYYSWTIEEFKGTNEEWEEYGGQIY